MADTQTKPNQQGTQEGTPAGGKGANPPTADELVALKKSVEDLQSKVNDQNTRIADKDRHINELREAKDLLDKRVQDFGRGGQEQTPANVSPQDIERQAKDILENANIDPDKASKDLTKLLTNVASHAAQTAVSGNMQQTQQVAENVAYGNKVREQNQDLIDFGFEPVITARANQLLQAGKSYKEAVDTAVSESREKIKKIKGENPNPKPEPNAEGGGQDGGEGTPASSESSQEGGEAPAGSQGESSTNQPEQTGKGQDEPEPSETEQRQAEQRNKGL